MCLIAWNWQPGSATPLLLLANRDEFYQREAAPLHWWEGGQVLAGRDLQAGGTWLGVNRSGQLAALTNYRLPAKDLTTRPSRGALLTDFLFGQRNAAEYLDSLLQRAGDYNPFNLLVFDGKQLMGLESRHRRVLTLLPGIGGVSNADFDTPWPKLLKLKKGLQTQILGARTAVPELLPLLQDRVRVCAAELPQTGVSLELESALSAAFVNTDHYGTRACSIVALHQKKSCFFEQSHGEHGMLSQTQQFFTP